MKKLLSGLGLIISLCSTCVQADSQVVYSCSKESNIYGDSQVVYNLAGFNSSPELYCKVKDLIEQALLNNCKQALEFGKEIVLKNFKVIPTEEAVKSFGQGNLFLDLEVEVESLREVNGKVQKSLVLEKVKIKFETSDLYKPTLDNLKVVDISSSGVCK